MKLLVVALFGLVALQCATAYKVVCYYEAWASMQPEDIDVNICTHINLAFVGVKDDGNIRQDIGDDMIRRAVNLKQKNGNLKVLLSVGGWSEGSEGFSKIAGDAGKKTTMAGAIQWYLDTFNLDGFDIDWEYPSQRGGNGADKENFVDMLWVIRNKIGTDKLITVAVSSIPDGGSYNVGAISKVVDAINVMTYDFHGSYDGKTGQNSPLYASSKDSEWERQNSNCDASISNWLNSGAEAGKVNIGLGFYGHSFQLADNNNHGVGAPTVGDGMNGGYVEFSQLCGLNDGWTTVFDNEQRVPYKYSGNQWIGYDNEQSIGEKVQYAKQRGLGGVMIWAVDEDCGKNLLNTIRDNL